MGRLHSWLEEMFFERIGGFDSRYFGWYEDNDLCWRIRLAGFKIVSIPKAKIYHAVSGSMSKLSKHTNLYYAERNKIATLIKNYTLFSIFEIIPAIIFFQMSETILLLATRKIHSAISIIKAIAWNILNLRLIWIEHLRIKYNVRKISDNEIKMYMVPFSPKELWRKARIV